jgi:hypothetical protein
VGVRSLIRGLLCCCLLAPNGAAQLPGQQVGLSNDSYLPTSAAAISSLRRGDADCLRALQKGPGAELAWGRAFESWHEALVASEVGDTVPVGMLTDDSVAVVPANQEQMSARWPDLDNSFARRTEAVEYAVLRRLCGLDVEDIARWTARFETPAADRLRSGNLLLGNSNGSRHTRLAAIERNFPATRAAVTAALQLLELELEAGRLKLAQNWLERARLNVSLLQEGASESLNAGLNRRANALANLDPRSREVSPAWTSASHFLPTASHPLVLPGYSKPRAYARYEGQPGIAFLSEGRYAVQTAGTIWLLSPDAEDRIFEPWRLAMELGHPIPRTVQRTGRDWPMVPVADGDALYLISGRADGTVMNVASNLVQKIRSTKELPLPQGVWSLGGNGLYNEDGHLPLEDVLEPGMWEFQPGPILVDDLLLVQARQWALKDSGDGQTLTTPGEARTWLLALDTNSGKPRWKHFLCRGTDVVIDLGVRFGSQLIRTPGAALQENESAVFVGTNLGAGFLIDMADGRLRWSFRNRRRQEGEPGWKPSARPSTLHAEDGVLLWASADCNELYPLSTHLDFAGPNSEIAPEFMTYLPLAIGESEEFLGGSASQALTFGRAGAQRTLSAHNLESGARYDSIYLTRDERWFTAPLISKDSMLCASSGGLYLLDRKQELYLAAFQPLKMSSDFAPGGLWARDNKIYLLADGALFLFESE